MKLVNLHEEQILSGYAALSKIYPHVPSLIIWRGWEYAAYQRYDLKEPVLDVGCGDGRFFQLVWPQTKVVVGVDCDQGALAAAEESGIYTRVLLTPAHHLPFPAGSFESAFANCSLEHMDHLDDVLQSILVSLKPGGMFLLSVVTDKFVQWASLPQLIRLVGDSERAQSLQTEYEKYHHLVSPLPPEKWVARLQGVGFEVLEYVPILPEMTSRLFLFLDHLWHVKHSNGELGDLMYLLFSGLSQFSKGFQQILLGFLQMETRWDITSGAVFHARRSQ